MLIQITNACNNCCKHCMNRSSVAELMHDMSDELYSSVLDFAVRCRSRAIVLSGGEPTVHPHFLDYFDVATKTFQMVVVATNGSWLKDKEFTDKMLERLDDKHPNVILQITAVPGLYKDAEEIQKLATDIFGDKYQDRVFVDTEIKTMKALGRAADDPELLKEAEKNATTTSCFPAAVAAAQFIDLADTVTALEVRGKFCKPSVDYLGRVRWSESNQCPWFGTIPADHLLTDAEFKALSKAARWWIPCGQCPDYKKLFDPKLGWRYRAGVELLGLTNIPKEVLNGKENLAGASS